MSEKREERKQRKSTAIIRKAGVRGIRTQKAMTFLIDLENVERLQGEKNKGRLINDLIRKHYEDGEV